MDHPAAKRVLTTSDASQIASDASKVSPEDELKAQILAASRRGRMNVNQGYTTERFIPSSTPTLPTNPPSTRSSIFRTANDTLRDVFASSIPQSTVSASRKRDREGRTSNAVGEDADMSDEELSLRLPIARRNSFGSSRPVKPLPTTSRTFRKTQSQPAGSTLFGTPQAATSMKSVSEDYAMEEDWSLSSFPPSASASMTAPPP